MIKGIWGDEAYRFKPEQWINVWLIDEHNQANYFGCCQVRNLLNTIGDSAPIDEFGLEPIDPDGNLIPVEEALR